MLSACSTLWQPEQFSARLRRPNLIYSEKKRTYFYVTSVGSYADRDFKPFFHCFLFLVFDPQISYSNSVKAERKTAFPQTTSKLPHFSLKFTCTLTQLDAISIINNNKINSRARIHSLAFCPQPKSNHNLNSVQQIESKSPEYNKSKFLYTYSWMYNAW